MAFNALAAALGISASESVGIYQPDGGFVHNRVIAFNQNILDQGVPVFGEGQFRNPVAENQRLLAVNAAQFGVNNPSEFLTNYAIRYTDPLQDALRSLREQLAPEVMSNNSSFVQYAVYGFTDAFLAMDNPLDVRRAVGADFTTVGNTSKTLASAKMPEIGLAVEIDEEEELLDGDWQQRKVAWLLGILDRTELRSSLALAVAGATNVNKTWDATAGKDPDQDIATEINAMQIPPSNIWIGAGAWIKRMLAHRAQNTAGGFASASLTPEGVGGLLNADVQVPRNRYASGAGVTSQIMGSVVLLFSAMPGMSRDDFSNLKTFFAPARNGQRRAVWIRQVGDKRWRIVVSTGKRLVALTSTIGLETITVS
jgi:hypothetical protein